jgi:predicted amidohydrolase YtcJ
MDGHFCRIPLGGRGYVEEPVNEKVGQGFLFSSDALGQSESWMIDLLLTNVRVRSGEALEEVTLSSLAIADGRIEACIPVKEDSVWRKQAKQQIDVEGALVLPGLVDAHTHLGWAGQALWDVNWQDVCDNATALKRVWLAASRIEQGLWLLGGGWTRDQLQDAELPTLAELDEITGETPLFLQSEDHSLALANSRALALMGINETWHSPGGGEYERDSNGKLTGRFKGTAARNRATAGVVPPRDHYRRRAELRAALRTLVQHGITEAHDIAAFPDLNPTPLVHEERSFTDVALFDDLEARGELPVRVTVRPSLRRWREAAVEAQRRKGTNSLIACRGTKLLLDSGLYSLPYPSSRYSYRYPGFGRALEWMRAADHARLQVSVHALGDLGVREALDLFEQVQESGSVWERHQRLIHACRIAPEDIVRIARLAIVVEAQPWDIAAEAETLTRHFDTDFLATAFPFRSLMDAGARVMFSSDWRMSQRPDQLDLDPLVAMYVAVTRTSPLGRDAPFQPHQRITLPEAIQCYTRTPAWAEGVEKRRGALAPGMDADLVVLSKDIVGSDPAGLLDARVLLTIVNGHVAYSGEEVPASRNSQCPAVHQCG